MTVDREEISPDAEAAIEASGDRFARGYLRAVQAALRHDDGEAAAALVLSEEALEFLDGDPALTSYWLATRINRTGSLLSLLRTEECGREIAETQRAAERYGDVKMAAQTHHYAVQLCWATGRWDEALVECEILEDAREYFSRTNAVAHAAMIAWHRDDTGAAQRWLAAAEHLEPVYSDWVVAARALALERGGDPAGALALLTDGPDWHQTRVRRQVRVELLLGTAVRIAAAVGDREAAALAAERAAGLASSAGAAPRLRLAAEYCQGAAAADVQELERVAVAYRRAGFRPQLAQTLESLAEAAAARGQTERARRDRGPGDL